MISQDIENKLGASGSFLIKEAGPDDKVLFRFKKDIFGNSELVIARDPYVWPPSEDIWMLDVQSENLGPYISFASFDDINQGSVLHFQKAYGNGPGQVQSGNLLGSILFTGYKDGGFVSSAGIESKVVSVSTYPAAEIFFSTSDGTVLENRMTIKSDGTINIAGLAGNGSGYVAVDNNGDLSFTASPPSIPDFSSEIEALRLENETLKKRLAKLEAIVEELAKQQ